VQAQAQRILRDFDREIAHHFEVEEQILFPVLAGYAEIKDLVQELLAEHSRMRGAIEVLRSRSDRALVSEFVSTLRRHVRKEENVLFEQAQQLLSRDQLDELGKNFGGGSCSLQDL
jgi:hemerythrin-like domain-containing protein